LSFFWPRIDSNVTAQTKHLLKLPFCMHPDTLKICAPLSLLNQSCVLSGVSHRVLSGVPNSAGEVAHRGLADSAGCASDVSLGCASDTSLGCASDTSLGCASDTSLGCASDALLDNKAQDKGGTLCCGSGVLPIFLVKALSSAPALAISR